MSWTLLARAADRSVAGVLPTWSLRLTVRLNEVGSWTIEVPRESTPSGWPAPGVGLVVLRDRQVIASGDLDEEAFAWAAAPDDPAAGQGLWSLTGDTDLGRLAYRIIYPTPARSWESQTDGYFTYPATGTATAETVLRATVSWQAGPDALSSRRVPGLGFAARSGSGGQVRLRERFTPLLDGLRKAALAGGRLVFDVRDALDGTVEFSVRAPVDRTRTARFGIELGNVESLNVRRISPSATVALVAGQGQKAGRELAELPDQTNDAAWGRREAFVDQRQVGTDLSTEERRVEYAKAAAELFDSAGERTSVAAVITDTPQVKWGRDFDLGDRVSILTPFGPVTDVVRQVDITVDATGVESISSVIGSSDPATSDPLAATVRRMAERISQLEREL